MLVTDRTLVMPGALAAAAAAAVAGGVDLVQVREKDLPDAALLDLVRAILLAIGRATTGHARVVVNGRPAVARAAETGLHLPEAAPPPEPEHTWPLWGRSVHDPAGAARAAAEGADYLVAGALFPTSSKPGVQPLGVDGLRRIVAAAGAVPVLAIGGITPARVALAIAAGAAGVAVRSDILGAADPEQAAWALRRALDDAPA
jgi:thiamine-phosphate diphosphorylase